MRRIVGIFWFITLWVAIGGVIALLTIESRSQREALVVESLTIVISDSLEMGSLVSSPMIRSLLKHDKIDPVGMAVTKVPLSLIEQTIGKNSYVKSVRSYIDYRGAMKIEVTQRAPLARLRLNGYNCYITSDGHIFDSPALTALDTPLVTGRYEPLFGTKYRGDVRACAEAKVAKIDLEIERIERERYPIRLREEENNRERSEIRRRYISRTIFESKDDFAERVKALREENRVMRERCAYRQRVIDADYAAITQKQDARRAAQKKVEKKCEDIHNLITFVEMVEGDPFWRDEITQIELSEGHDGSMRVAVAVRSGAFMVTLGEICGGDDGVTSGIRSKLDRLQMFYNEALPRVGWDRYKEINIEFTNQVVCKR